MNIKKLMAGSLAAITAGATLGAFAIADMSDYVSHSDGTLTSPMIVIGSTAGDATAYPKDVAAAGDLAAHVAGHATTPVTTTGTKKSFSISGEGKEIATANTNIFLDDNMGKSGVRTTMTKEDLPTILESGTVVDNQSTSIKYDQYLFLTPSTSNRAAFYSLQFERPTSSSSDDGTYSFGRLPTSPTDTNYFVNYRLSFRKDTSFPNLIGEQLKIAGETYTVLSGSDSAAATPVLRATKAAASQSIYVSDGEVEITVGDVTHTVAVIGTSDTDTVVVSVNGKSKSATRDATTTINTVDVYVDDVFHFANNQESSGASLLIGAEQIRFQNASKVKLGTNEDNVDGTYVKFTQSGGKISTMDIYFAGPASSVTDNLRMGTSYTLPTLSKLAIHFPGISEDLTGDTRNELKVAASGDNLLQMTWTDDSSNENTMTWAYKSTATGTTFSLADSNGKLIHTQENLPVSQDEYLILDAGDFPHMLQMTGIDSSALSFTLKDAFSSESVKYELAASDNGQKTIYIDGQAYNAKFDVTNTSVNFTWGDSAAFDNVGDATTVWPTLKGKNGEKLAFINSTGAVINVTNATEIQLPTGAVQITMNYFGDTIDMNLTAVTDEDGEASACTATPCVTSFNTTEDVPVSFTLGKTSTGGVVYNISRVTDNNTIRIQVMGTSAETTVLSQPALLIFEEKDDSSNRYSALVQATTEESGSNNVAKPEAPIFTADEDSQARGSDSTITDYVDIYGLHAVRTTTGQDVVTLYYPDEQVYAVIGAGDASATASVGGATGTTVDAAVVITSPVTKLDNEISSSSLSSDLILVGGPCANTLVAELAADETTGVPACDAWTLETGLIKEVDDAFGSGHKALVVAGTTADNTRSLAAQVMSGTLSYEV